MRILHICDLQIGIESSRERTEEELEDRRRYFHDLDIGLEDIVERHPVDYILITGDIAYSASREDYEKAEDWLRKASAICKIPMEHIYLCPGNHDMDRETGSFKEYEAFCHRVGVARYTLAGRGNYLTGVASNADMNVICLNTPWFVKDISLGFTLMRLIKRERKYANGLFTIAIMHHGSLMENKGENAGQKKADNICLEICGAADMVLTGHQGRSGSGYRYRNDTYICGNGAVYEDDHYHHNFHVYEIESHSEGGTDCACTVYEYNGIGWRRQSGNIKIAISDKGEGKREQPLRHSFSILWWTRLES